jgi:protein-S-isoprenylcysteine O-methyltransferase Ste14
MIIYNFLIILCWLVFLVYWGVSAFSAKKTVGGMWRWFGIRVAILVIVLLVVGKSAANSPAIHTLKTAPNHLAGIIGVIITALGIAFAVWARKNLGANWGMPMTVKENPELVTSGPYNYVRHPIYTGVLLAILGSAFIAGPFWIVIFIVACGYFTYSALREEKNMIAKFPDTYPAYKKRTKMLVPFIF